LSAISFADHFAALPDPRVARSRQHLLLEILIIAFLATLCGAEGWEDMEEFGLAKEAWLRGRLGLRLPGGIPSDETFRRLFARLDPEAFGRCFRLWVETLGKKTKGRVIAVDGKALRHSFDKACGQEPVHMVRAWACEARLVLGALPTDQKSNEIPTVRALLGLLDLKGAIVTADAAHAQKETAARIREKQGNYLLALKDNHPHLRQDALGLWERLHRHPAAPREWTQVARGRSVTRHTEHDVAHGRQETRITTIITLAPEDPDWQDVQREWSGLRAFVFVERTRRTEKGETQHTACFLASFSDSAKTMGRLIRKHWRIENGLHYVLDVTFREDACSIRRSNAPANLAILRDGALNLLGRRPKNQRGIKARQKRAGWDTEYLLQLLA
jgi:predicted transposase YbfD/YdcC